MKSDLSDLRSSLSKAIMMIDLADDDEPLDLPIVSRTEGDPGRFGINELVDGLEQARKGHQMTRKAMASRMDTSRSQLRRLMCGECNVTIKTLAKAAEVLDLTLELRLVGEIPDPFAGHSEPTTLTDQELNDRADARGRARLLAERSR